MLVEVRRASISIANDLRSPKRVPELTKASSSSSLSASRQFGLGELAR